MDDSQSPSQPQSQPQQHRVRGRLGDANISRRPRAVAGQRAAAKRAAQPAQRGRATPAVETIEPQEAGESVRPARSAEAAAAVEPTDPAQLAELVRPASDQKTAADAADVATGDQPSASKADRTGDASARTRLVRRAVVTAVLAVALIAVLAVGAVLAVHYREAIRTDHARTAAMAEAERAAPVIFSYDYRHLDQDFGKAEALLTGPFRDQYAKTTQTVVKPTALQYHGVVTATVARPADGSAPAVSVVSASPDQVVVLAFIDQSTTSTRVNGTQVDQNRVLLTLTHTPQGWRVSAVDAL